MSLESLKQNSQFRYLYRRGKSYVTGTLVMYVSKNRLGRNRLGITAGKKVGCAVRRNKAKRRIRESFRLFQTQLEQGYDFCIVARSRTVEAPYEKLTENFKTAAKALGVWKGEENIEKVAD